MEDDCGTVCGLVNPSVTAVNNMMDPTNEKSNGVVLMGRDVCLLASGLAGIFLVEVQVFARIAVPFRTSIV